MTTTLTCPDETELLVLAMGDPVAADVTAHVGGCASCRTKLERLKAEVAILRQNHGDGTTLQSTEQDPTVDHEGEPPDAGTTRDWTSAPSAAKQDTHRPGPEAVAEARAAAEGFGELPDAIGKYKVVGWLGAGGEADVYRVVHITLGNDLVLKLSRRRVGATNQFGLIEQGRLLVDLQHPNLVRIHDLDFHDDRPFLVMEYVHGRDLEQYFGEEPVTQRRAAALVAKLAEVMAVAHRHGITHCDIKPRNILIDKAGEPRLIDFGMARMRHAWTDRVESSVGGTIAFMAPEQARLEIDRIGPRSDIFALGGVLYYLLTGQAPFVGETHEEAWDRARRCDFEAGALRAAKVPRRLERICLKALAAEPSGRYDTAESLAKALESYLRRPLMIAASALLVLMTAVAFGAWSLWPPPAPSAERSVVIHQVQAVPTALTGELIIKVKSKADGTERELKAGDASARPLLPGENVRLEARLNQAAYAYLLWVDGQGHASLLYPRKDGKFGSRPSGGSARDTVHSPEALDEWHRMSGPGGMDTVLLLVRRKPLPSGTDLAALIGPLPPSPLRPGLIFATRGLDEGHPIESLRPAVPMRGIDEEAEKLDEPVLRLMERLRTQDQFEVVKAAQFAYRGE